MWIRALICTHCILTYWAGLSLELLTSLPRLLRKAGFSFPIQMTWWHWIWITLFKAVFQQVTPDLSCCGARPIWIVDKKNPWVFYTLIAGLDTRLFLHPQYGSNLNENLLHSPYHYHNSSLTDFRRHSVRSGSINDERDKPRHPLDGSQYLFLVPIGHFWNSRNTPKLRIGPKKCCQRISWKKDNSSGRKLHT